MRFQLGVFLFNGNLNNPGLGRWHIRKALSFFFTSRQTGGVLFGGKGQHRAHAGFLLLYHAFVHDLSLQEKTKGHKDVGFRINRGHPAWPLR